MTTLDALVALAREQVEYAHRTERRARELVARLAKGTP